MYYPYIKVIPSFLVDRIGSSPFPAALFCFMIRTIGFRRESIILTRNCTWRLFPDSKEKTRQNLTVICIIPWTPKIIFLGVTWQVIWLSTAFPCRYYSALLLVLSLLDWQIFIKHLPPQLWIVYWCILWNYTMFSQIVWLLAQAWLNGGPSLKLSPLQSTKPPQVRSSFRLSDSQGVMNIIVKCLYLKTRAISMVIRTRENVFFGQVSHVTPKKRNFGVHGIMQMTVLVEVTTKRK